MRRNLLFILFAMLMLAACKAGGAEETDVSTSASDTANTTDIDVSTLAPQIDVQTTSTVYERDDIFMLDVREQWEYDEGHIPDITLIPMGDIPNRLDELPRDKEIIVTCRSGNRSGQITALLQSNGFTNIHNMQGGILAWESAGLPVDK